MGVEIAKGGHFLRQKQEQARNLPFKLICRLGRKISPSRRLFPTAKRSSSELFEEIRTIRKKKGVAIICLASSTVKKCIYRNEKRNAKEQRSWSRNTGT